MIYHITNKDFMFGNHNVMKDFQNPGGLGRITIFNFAAISKIFSNTIKIIYLDIYNENAIQHLF